MRLEFLKYFFKEINSNNTIGKANWSKNVYWYVKNNRFIKKDTSYINNKYHL